PVGGRAPQSQAVQVRRGDPHPSPSWCDPWAVTCLLAGRGRRPGRRRRAGDHVFLSLRLLSRMTPSARRGRPMVQSHALAQVVDLLDLEQIEVDIFRGRSPEGERRQRVFGGQVAGQALVAAGPRVPADRPGHSLPAYFIRPGDPTVPLVSLVERVRDGRSFTPRRVTTVQHGKTIFTLSASFHRDEPGVEHADPMPVVPPPEAIESTAERMEKVFGPAAAEWFGGHPIDIRHIGPLTVEAQRDPSLRTARSLVWLRAGGELP